MKKRSAFRRRKRKRRTTACRLPYSLRRPGSSSLGTPAHRFSVCVFSILLMVYLLSGPASGEKTEGDTTAVLSGISVLTEKIKEIMPAESEQGSNIAAAEEPVTLKSLAALSDREISVYMESSGDIKNVPLEEYVACVVASEMPSDFETEALKAQAVAARTYAAARSEEFQEGKCAHYDDGAFVCDTTHCQVWRDEDALKEIKGETWMEESFPKILDAVYSTAGKVLYYDGVLVKQPLFFSSGGDRTENSEDVFVSAVPYLRSVESGAYEEGSPHREVETVLTMEELKRKVSASYGAGTAESISAETIDILGRTAGGAVARMKLGDLELTGRQVRSLCGLPSADFEVRAEADAVTFITSGSGHRVGLSQYGANGMAQQGKTCEEILRHYYSGVEIGAIS